MMFSRSIVIAFFSLLLIQSISAQICLLYEGNTCETNVDLVFGKEFSLPTSSTTIINGSSNVTGSSYNATYANLLGQTCPIGQVVNGTLSNGTLRCTSVSASGGSKWGTNGLNIFNFTATNVFIGGAGLGFPSSKLFVQGTDLEGQNGISAVGGTGLFIADEGAFPGGNHLFVGGVGGGGNVDTSSLIFSGANGGNISLVGGAGGTIQDLDVGVQSIQGGTGGLISIKGGDGGNAVDGDENIGGTGGPVYIRSGEGKLSASSGSIFIDVGNVTQNYGAIVLNSQTPQAFVGIATSSPSRTLDVRGQVVFNQTLYVNANGRVGIGTASPNAALQIVVNNGPISIQGQNNFVTGNLSSAVGMRVNVTGNNSRCTGNFVNCTGNNQFVIGDNMNIAGANTVALGQKHNDIVSAPACILIGNNVDCSGASAGIGIGQNINLTGSTSIALGDTLNNSGDYTILMGRNGRANANSDTSFFGGFGVSANDSATAFGFGENIGIQSSSYAFLVGRTAKISGSNYAQGLMSFSTILNSPGSQAFGSYITLNNAQNATAFASNLTLTNMNGTFVIKQNNSHVILTGPSWNDKVGIVGTPLYVTSGALPTVATGNGDLYVSGKVEFDGLTNENDANWFYLCYDDSTGKATYYTVCGGATPTLYPIINGRVLEKGVTILDDFNSSLFNSWSMSDEIKGYDTDSFVLRVTKQEKATINILEKIIQYEDVDGSLKIKTLKANITQIQTNDQKNLIINYLDSVYITFENPQVDPSKIISTKFRSKGFQIMYADDPTYWVDYTIIDKENVTATDFEYTIQWSKGVKSGIIKRPWGQQDVERVCETRSICDLDTLVDYYMKQNSYNLVNEKQKKSVNLNRETITKSPKMPINEQLPIAPSESI